MVITCCIDPMQVLLLLEVNVGRQWFEEEYFRSKWLEIWFIGVFGSWHNVWLCPCYLCYPFYVMKLVSISTRQSIRPFNIVWPQRQNCANHTLQVCISLPQNVILFFSFLVGPPHMQYATHASIGLLVDQILLIELYRWNGKCRTEF